MSAFAWGFALGAWACYGAAKLGEFLRWRRSIKQQAELDKARQQVDRLREKLGAQTWTVTVRRSDLTPTPGRQRWVEIAGVTLISVVDLADWLRGEDLDDPTADAVCKTIARTLDVAALQRDLRKTDKIGLQDLDGGAS